MSYGLTVPMYVSRASMSDLENERDAVRDELEVVVDQLRALAFAGPAALPPPRGDDDHWEWMEYAPQRLRDLLNELESLHIRQFQLSVLAAAEPSEIIES